MLKSKVSGLRVTSSSIQGEGALWLERELMKKADLWPFERVEVANAENGARFSTCVLEAEPGSNAVRVTGPDAFLVKPGDRITVSAYLQLEEAQLSLYRPRVLSLS
jgi:aspartate 1-decarboxylase